MKVVLASQNRHKLEEIQAILSRYDMELVLEKDLGLCIEVEETGTTFEENSMLKARAVMEATGLPTIADDSGLAVDVLGGEPGIYSARYLGRDTDYNYKMGYIIDRLKDTPWEARTARFTASVAAVLPDGTSYTATGHMEGYIGYEIAGENGFGYDPFFYLPEYQMTSAQISPEQKNAISHRGRALRAMLHILEEQGVL